MLTLKFDACVTDLCARFQVKFKLWVMKCLSNEALLLIVSSLSGRSLCGLCTPPPSHFSVCKSTHVPPSRGTKTFRLVSDVHVGPAVKNTRLLWLGFFIPKPVYLCIGIKKLQLESNSEELTQTLFSSSLYYHTAHSHDCITQQLSSLRVESVRSSKYIQHDLISDRLTCSGLLGVISIHLICLWVRGLIKCSLCVGFLGGWGSVGTSRCVQKRAVIPQGG